MSALVSAPKKVEIDAALAVIKGGHEVSNAHTSVLALGADDETRAAHKDSAAKLKKLDMHVQRLALANRKRVEPTSKLNESACVHLEAPTKPLKNLAEILVQLGLDAAEKSHSLLCHILTEKEEVVEYKAAVKDAVDLDTILVAASNTLLKMSLADLQSSLRGMKTALLGISKHPCHTAKAYPRRAVSRASNLVCFPRVTCTLIERALSSQ